MIPDTSPPPDRFVLWCLDGTTARLLPPVALLTGAPSVAVARWLLENPWAADLPRWRFAKADDAHEARGKASWTVSGGRKVFPFRLFADPGDDLCLVLPEGSAERVPLPWREPLEIPPGHPNRVQAAVVAASEIARHVRGPVWEIEAQHTGCALAVGVAVAQGRAVAVGPGVPGPFCAAVSTAHGVSIKTVLDADALRVELKKRERTA